MNTSQECFKFERRQRAKFRLKYERHKYLENVFIITEIDTAADKGG